MTFDVKTDPARPDAADADADVVTGTIAADAAATAATAASRRRRLFGSTHSRRAIPPATDRRARLRSLLSLFPSLPLQLVLTAQAALTLRLSNTAFADEALVLNTGRQEISALLHGANGTAGFAAYFSGEPYLYPVLASAVDSQFGLEAARLLSLLFMLGATVLLWSSTRALFGRSAAIGATVVFGLAGPTLFLGHFAVYDVPAVFLYAASLRILIATARRNLWTTLFAVPTTVLAIATSYATALYLPVLALVAAFTAASAASAASARAAGPGARARDSAFPFLRALLLVGATTALIMGWITLFGPGLRQALATTTSDRLVGSDPSGTIIGDSLQWGIVALVLGVLGTLAVAKRRRTDPRDPHNVAPVLLTLTLTVSVMLAPAYQLHIHTWQSLQKHMDIGLLFCAAAAGVALSIPLRAAFRARVRYGVLALATLALVAIGADQSGKLFDYWPNSASLATVLKQAMGKGGGHYLAESSSVPQYYTASLADGAHNDWQSTYFFGYVDSAGKYVTGLDAYKQAIKEHYFKLIVLSYTETPTIDAQIESALMAQRGYQLIDVIPNRDVFGESDYAVWEAETV